MTPGHQQWHGQKSMLFRATFKCRRELTVRAVLVSQPLIQSREIPNCPLENNLLATPVDLLSVTVRRDNRVDGRGEVWHATPGKRRARNENIEPRGV